MQNASTSISGSINVLVVDDDVAVLTVIACMLRGGGYNVLLASDAASAVGLAERKSVAIDLALLDVVMPDVSGPDLAERMRAMRPDLKVLFMSGYVDSEVIRIKALDRGLDFLPKPFTADGLLESVDRALRCADPCAAAAKAGSLIHR